MKHVRNILKSTIRSALFLATSVIICQVGLCIYSFTFPQNRAKAFIYLIGILAGFSVLIEQKSRRAELAMFVLPKALDSTYQILVSKRTIPRIPYFDVIGSCFSMSVLMSMYQVEPEMISPMLYRILSALIGKY